MSKDTSEQKRGPSDATDYSSSKAPETKDEAEDRHEHPTDSRLQPGGPMGTAADPGMSSLDRDSTPTGARRPELQDFGSTEDDPR